MTLRITTSGGKNMRTPGIRRKNRLRAILLIPRRLIKEAASDQIRAIDFHVRQYPIDTSLFDLEMDRKYREAFYQAVTNRKPVLCRAYRSLDYEENTYQYILRSDSLSDQEFLRQELKQDSGYYYVDYDGDGAAGADHSEYRTLRFKI